LARIEEAYDLAIMLRSTGQYDGRQLRNRTHRRAHSQRQAEECPVSVEAGFQEQEVLETDVTIVEAPVEPVAPCKRL
jgi:hypothetical protein